MKRWIQIGRTPQVMVRVWADETAQDMSEYALVASMVALATAIATPLIYQQVIEILANAVELLSDAS